MPSRNSISGVTDATSETSVAFSAFTDAVFTMGTPFWSNERSLRSFTWIVMTASAFSSSPTEPSPSGSVNSTVTWLPSTTGGFEVAFDTETLPGMISNSAGMRSASVAPRQPRSAIEEQPTSMRYSMVSPGLSVSLEALFWISSSAVSSAAIATWGAVTAIPRARAAPSANAMPRVNELFVLRTTPTPCTLTQCLARAWK